MPAPPYPTFHLHLYGLGRSPLATSFEQAIERLEVLEKLHAEPDGSFVWVCERGQQQIFGMLYDAAGCLQYVELRGTASRETWMAICDAISGGDRNLSVLSLADGSLKDLQSFEQMTWPNACDDKIVSSEWIRNKFES